MCFLKFGALFAGCCFIGQASVIDFVTPAGSMTGGQPVAASALFTTGVGTITVLLTNLEANPTSVVQNLSDLEFTLSSGTASGAVYAATGNSAQEITVNSNGTFATGSTLTTSGSIGWVLTVPTTQNIQLDVLGAGGAGPAHLLIGPPGTGSVYSNANDSIAGNGPHNPFLNQTATWVINAPNVSATTTISAATFSFGTTEGGNLVTGVPLSSPVPEPGSFSCFLLLGVGGVSLMAVGRRRAFFIRNYRAN
jgi:hypothetical protein